MPHSRSKTHSKQLQGLPRTMTTTKLKACCSKPIRPRSQKSNESNQITQLNVSKHSILLHLRCSVGRLQCLRKRRGDGMLPEAFCHRIGWKQPCMFHPKCSWAQISQVQQGKSLACKCCSVEYMYYVQMQSPETHRADLQTLEGVSRAETNE